MEKLLIKFNELNFLKTLGFEVHKCNPWVEECRDCVCMLNEESTPSMQKGRFELYPINKDSGLGKLILMQDNSMFNWILNESCAEINIGEWFNVVNGWLLLFRFMEGKNKNIVLPFNYDKMEKLIFFSFLKNQYEKELNRIPFKEACINVTLNVEIGVYEDTRRIAPNECQIWLNLIRNDGQSLTKTVLPLSLVKESLQVLEELKSSLGLNWNNCGKLRWTSFDYFDLEYSDEHQIEMMQISNGQ